MKRVGRVDIPQEAFPCRAQGRQHYRGLVCLLVLGVLCVKSLNAFITEIAERAEKISQRESLDKPTFMAQALLERDARFSHLFRSIRKE